MFALPASKVLIDADSLIAPAASTKIDDRSYRIVYQRDCPQVQKSMVDEAGLTSQSAFRPAVGHLLPPTQCVAEALIALSIAEMLLACQSTAHRFNVTSSANPTAMLSPQRLYQEALQDLKMQSIQHLEQSLGITDSHKLSHFAEMWNQMHAFCSFEDVERPMTATAAKFQQQPVKREKTTETLFDKYPRFASGDKDHDWNAHLSRPASLGSSPSQHLECERCQKSYTTESGLLKHQSQHCTTLSRKQYACQECDKHYHSMCALKMHMRTHTLPCQCSICGKAFSRMWLLNGHIRTHTGEKPFNCDVCQRAFADRSNLRAHMQTHSGLKRYKCEACCRTFSRMGLLTKHRCSVSHS